MMYKKYKIKKPIFLFPNISKIVPKQETKKLFFFIFKIIFFLRIFFKYFFVMNYGNKKTNSKKMKKKINFQKYFIESKICQEINCQIQKI